MIDGAFGVFAKMGKMAGCHDLALREPYLDLNMVSFLCTLPQQWKVQGSIWDCLRRRDRPKRIMYEAARDILPAEVLTKKKHGFDAPVRNWLDPWLVNRNAEALLPTLAQSTDLLNWEFLNKTIMAEHRNGDCDHATLLMLLIGLDLWYEIFICQRGRRPAWTWRDSLENRR